MVVLYLLFRVGSVRPQQEKEETFLKHKSQTLINPAHEVQATTLTLSVPNRHSVGNDRDNRTLKRTFSRAQLTKMDTGNCVNTLVKLTVRSL